jgi:nucleotide-binding universal stress UspA family protein
MRRVLVPLDGTGFAASILPDARLLAGTGGEVILLGDPMGSVAGPMSLAVEEGEAVRETLASLEVQAERLRGEGIKIETHVLLMTDPAYAIQSAIRLYDAGAVACSTHGRGPLGRLRRGSVAWRILADSPVPVLIRHIDEGSSAHATHPHEPRIMVPLDGSAQSERALPLAQELAAEWNASIWLIHVVSHFPISGLPRTDVDPGADTDDLARRSAQRYLSRIAHDLPRKVHWHVRIGPVAERLATAVREWKISHVVMTSHGRTSLARVMLGSTTDEVIQHVSCPVIVVPAHVAASRVQQEQPEASTV